jgi:hypothetical protein
MIQVVIEVAPDVSVTRHVNAERMPEFYEGLCKAVNLPRDFNSFALYEKSKNVR